MSSYGFWATPRVRGAARMSEGMSLEAPAAVLPAHVPDSYKGSLFVSRRQLPRKQTLHGTGCEPAAVIGLVGF